MILPMIARWCIRLLPIAYMGFIWFLSSRPSDAVVRLGRYDGLIKESLHLVEFGILYALFVLAFLTFGHLSRRHNRVAVIMAIAYGCIDELHQAFVPSRSADVIDIVKDVIGVCVAWYIVHRTYFRNDASKIGRFLRRITLTLTPPIRNKPDRKSSADL